MKYSPDYIAKELRSLAALVEAQEDGLEWGNLVQLVENGKAFLNSRQLEGEAGD